MRRLLAGALLAILLGAGCVVVQPWERRDLARPTMALDPDPDEQALEQHFLEAREAASGVPAAGGGGCGCN